MLMHAVFKHGRGIMPGHNLYNYNYRYDIGCVQA